MAGWKSRYDYDGMSNVERHFGRKTHVQDNCWIIAQPLLVIFVILCVYGVMSVDHHVVLGAFTSFIKNLKFYLHG